MKARKARENAWCSLGLDRSSCAVSAPIMSKARGSSRTLGSSRSWCAARRMATRCAVRLNLPSCIFRLGQLQRGKTRRWKAISLLQVRGLAFVARTDFTQELPGIDAKVVIVVPGKADGIFTDCLGGNRPGGGFEHGKHAGSELGRLTGFAPGLVALFIAHGAGAGISQVDKIVVRNVAVSPLDVHARAGGEVHFDRLGICGRSGRLKRGLHVFSIVYGK